jgi:redox-sensitive bicupin YhaK (pirin superfamily)
LTDVHLATATLAGLSHAELPIPANSHVLFYVIRGKVVANGKALSKGQLAQFSTDGGKLTLEGVEDDSLILLGYGTPYHEPIVAHGPFVLNTEAEIRQAYADFRQGRFGAWPTK